jgi:hypothetical protein
MAVGVEGCLGARGWSQADAIRAMRAHSAKELPSTSSLLRQYKRWEAGEVTPKEFYQPIIAETFGTVTHAMFPVAPKRDADADVLAVTGMDTLELVSRLQRSDLDQATLDGLRIMADRLCSEYPFMPSDQLLVEGRSWLRRVVSFQGQRLTLNQHREILTLAGWIALLIACVEYDSGDRQAAETTRKAIAPCQIPPLRLSAAIPRRSHSPDTLTLKCQRPYERGTGEHDA